MAFPPSVSPAGPYPNATAAAQVNFWDIPGAGGGSIIAYTPAQVAQALADALAAYHKAMASGTKSYHVGTRGLERISIPDILEAIKFWTNMQGAISPNGTMSAIQTRRGVPCDV